MLHLAQVVKNSTSGKLQLHLLAVEESKLQWTFCYERYISIMEENNFSEDIFVLVDLDEDNQIIQFKPAKEWILNLIKEYLVKGEVNKHIAINIPDEQVRLEKWRQELTAQSQDLTRIRLEVETRREELQQLEQNLSLEREKLKSTNN